jgi:hypothetical protein
MLGWLFGKSTAPKRKRPDMGGIIAQAAQFLIEALRTQMEEMDGIEKGFPAPAKDPYSLGYVVGFTEAVAAMRNLDSDTQGYVVHQAVFTDLFGAQEGPLLFASFMKLQGEGNEEVLMGMTIGGEDMFGWLNGEIEAPKRWAEYVNKNG